MAGGVWKRGNPGYRKQNFSFLRWFYAVLLNIFLSTGTSPSQPRSWQMTWIHSQLSSLGASYAPKTSDILKRGNPGCRKKIFSFKNEFSSFYLTFSDRPAPNCDVECIPLNLRTTEEAHMIGLLFVFLFYTIRLKLVKTWKKEFEKK